LRSRAPGSVPTLRKRSNSRRKMRHRTGPTGETATRASRFLASGHSERRVQLHACHTRLTLAEHFREHVFRTVTREPLLARNSCRSASGRVIRTHAPRHAEQVTVVYVCFASLRILCGT